jgi:tetratricopeptide (TPR) repeat protein
LFEQGDEPRIQCASARLFCPSLCSVEALVGSAVVDQQSAVGSFTDDRIERLTAAETAATKALSLAPNHARAHNILGGIFAFTNRVAQGIAECERALMLDRNMATAHAAIGMMKYFIGRGAETEGHVCEALRLSPRDFRVYQWMSYPGIAKLWQGADAEAAVWLRRSVEANRNYPLAHFYLAVALAYLGELDEARAAVQAGLALHPSFTIRRYRASAACNHHAYLAGRERTYEGLRLAGVPE